MAVCSKVLVEALAALFHQPSFVTIVAFLPKLGSTSLAVLLTGAFRFEVEMRLAAAAALLIHEASHLAASSLLVPSSLMQATVHCPGLALFLLPTASLKSSCVHVPDAASLTDLAKKVVKSAGLLVSLVLPLGALWLHPSLSAAQLSGLAIPALGAILSDLPSGPLLGSEAPAGAFCCGNWGMLLAREALEDMVGGAASTRLLPEACEALLKSVLDIVELRGAQAGGALTFVGTRDGHVEAVRSRTVKSKRGHLGSSLFRRFRWEMCRRRAARLCHLDRLRRLPVVLVQGHSRFGTSSSPAVGETHPHQWLGPHVEKVWRFEGGCWSCRRETVCTTITHNGDYDGSILYDSTVPNGLLGDWLSRVQHVSNGAKGDSPKLAGMMDLLLCQGMWCAAVRCAFAFAVMQHVDEAFGWEEPGSAAGFAAANDVPSPAIFEEWAAAFEDAFERATAADTQVHPSAEVMEELALAAAAGLAENRHRMSNKALKATQRWGLTGGLLHAFSKEVVFLFFKRDLLTSVWCFFAGAVGTFGMSVSCSLWPHSIVMAAKGQPISVAFNADNSLAFWSSEPNALDVPNAWKAAKASKRVAAARWDMNDAQGEVIELRTIKGWETPESLLGFMPGQHPDATFFSLPGGSTGKPVGRIVVRGMDLQKTPRALDRESFRSRWVRLRAPPPAMLPHGKGDPIAKDLRDVPAVLAELEDSWADPSALNYMTGSNFARSLGELLAAQGSDPQSIDVLIFGIENSLWLAQQFAADLSRLFPRLNISCLSSNWVLGLLQKAHGQIEPLNFALPRERFAFKKNAIALAVSHSGTTYPTVWCARLLAQRPEQLKLFAMSGVLESVLANSIGQGQTKNEFSGMLFSTMAGVRPCEPSTVATMAMHHSFSLLLLRCASTSGRHDLHHTALCGGPASSSSAVACPAQVRCQLQPGDVADLRRIVMALLPAAQQLCGFDGQRQSMPASLAREDLLRVGDYFAQQLLEAWYATLSAAIYIYFSVTLSLPLFGTLRDLIFEDVPMDLSLNDAVQFVAAFLDAHLYVFLAAVVATVHRLITGRRLFTRYTSRSIVVVESTVNYKLLRAYISKLGALAFRFTSFGVAGQNGADHFVHEMTHKTTSEAILFVGRPDGRLGTLAASERAVLLSIQQARFVASRKNSGIEMVSLGHNPWQKDGLCVKDVALPTTHRPDFLSSVLLHSGKGAQDPLDVCHRLAMMGGDDTAPNTDLPLRWVGKERVLEEMSGQSSVPLEEALRIIQGLVEESCEGLGIDFQRFEIANVLSTTEVTGAGGTSEHSASPSEHSHRGLKALLSGFAGTRRRESPDFFTASDLVAILRGKAMADELRSLQHQELTTCVARNALAELHLESLREAFQAWLSFHKDPELKAERRAENKQAKRRDLVASQVTVARRRAQELPGAEWRVQEEYRRRRRQWLTSYKTSKFGARACFQAWRSLVFQRINAASRSARSRPTLVQSIATPTSAPITPFTRAISASTIFERAVSPLSCQSCTTTNMERNEDTCAPVGARRLNKISSHEELVEQLALMERLHETRTAAAERLLASFIIFHHAVRPLSRLWGLSFDMDRSESRLRVASTPAPVPFVEKFAAKATHTNVAFDV